MIEEGHGYGVAIAVQMLLRKLEDKGLLSPSEVVAVLDSACDEISELQKRKALSPDAAADAARTVGLLYLPKNPGASSIAFEDSARRMTNSGSL